MESENGDEMNRSTQPAEGSALRPASNRPGGEEASQPDRGETAPHGSSCPDPATRPDLALIGPGRLGLRLAGALARSGWRCIAVRDRAGAVPPRSEVIPAGATFDTWERPAAWPTPSLVLVCVPDDEIPSVARRIASSLGRGSAASRETPGQGLRGVCVVHTSGLLPASVLEPCVETGAWAASWHPLQSFPAHGSAEPSLQGVACAIEGDEPAVALGEEMARTLGMEPWRIDPERKPTYHAAAVIAANLTHILIRKAAELLKGCGLPEELAASALTPLVMHSTASALGATGLEALTGPAARGDAATMRTHLDALPPSLAEAYRAVSHLLPTPGPTDGLTRQVPVGGPVDHCG